MKEQKRINWQHETSASFAIAERLPLLVSAYLDDQLEPEDAKIIAALLKNDPVFSSQIVEMKKIQIELARIGDDILAEPIPETLLEALSNKA